MTAYNGKITLDYWTNANDREQVERKINDMLNRWDFATQAGINWDNADWTIEEAS